MKPSETLLLSNAPEIRQQVDQEVLAGLTQQYALESSDNAQELFFDPITESLQIELTSDQRNYFVAGDEQAQEAARMNTIIRKVMKGTSLSKADIQQIDKRLSTLEIREQPLRKNYNSVADKADTESRVQVRIAERARDREYERADEVESQADAKAGEIESRKLAEQQAVRQKHQDELRAMQREIDQLGADITELTDRNDVAQATRRIVAELKSERQRLMADQDITQAALRHDETQAIEEIYMKAVRLLEQAVSPLRLQAEQIRIQADDVLEVAKGRANTERERRIGKEQAKLDVITTERLALEKIRDASLASQAAGAKAAVSSGWKVDDKPVGWNDRVPPGKNRSPKAPRTGGASRIGRRILAGFSAVKPDANEQPDAKAGRQLMPSDPRLRRRLGAALAFTAVIGTGSVYVYGSDDKPKVPENVPAGVLAYTDTLQEVIKDNSIVIDVTGSDGKKAKWNLLSGEGIVGDDSRSKYDYRNVLDAAMLLTSGGNPDYKYGLLPLPKDLVDKAAAEMGVKYDGNDPKVALEVVGRVFNTVSAEVMSSQDNVTTFKNDPTGLEFYKAIARKMGIFKDDEKTIDLFARLSREWEGGVRKSDLVTNIMNANSDWAKLFDQAETAVIKRGLLSQDEVDSYS